MLADACYPWYPNHMNNAQLGGFARSRSLTSAERSRISRRAARARWARRDDGILHLSTIRKQVAAMLCDRDAIAYLFGSYARGDARPHSDVDLLVVEKKLPQPRLIETFALRKRLSLSKDIDLIVIDAENFETWKSEPGTVQHEAYQKGVRLV